MSGSEMIALPLQAVAEHLMMERLLQQSSANANDYQNRILYIAYLCVLGCCCVTPCLYFLRISVWQHRHSRRLREMEHAGMIAALAQSTAAGNPNYHHHHRGGGECAAAREERRARILQLMEPVRMTLKEEHFKAAHPVYPASPLPEHPLPETDPSYDDNDEQSPAEDEELGVSKRNQGKTVNTTFSDDTSVSSSVDGTDPTVYHFDKDEESILIEIPLPGLVLTRSEVDSSSALVSATARTGTTRLVPGFCTICLSGFVAGSDIVWSSNKKCEHCFHCECMEHWLTRQKPGATEGPICPCCRRDFIVDPYDDLTSSQHAENEASNNPGETNDDQGSEEEQNYQESAVEPPPLQLNWGGGGNENEVAGDGNVNADCERSLRDRV